MFVLSRGVPVLVMLKATGDAPILKQTKFKVAKAEKFVFISEFLRKNLKIDNVVSEVLMPCEHTAHKFGLELSSGCKADH